MEGLMRKKVTLITGACGEVGQALIKSLSDGGQDGLVTMDVRPLPPAVSKYSTHIQGDILDKTLLSRVVSEYEVIAIYHLAALLSTRAEFTRCRPPG
jgi:nucleoside-diphosphate-sugar epimerase